MNQRLVARKRKFFSSAGLQKHVNINTYILLAYFFSSCDTMSAMYGKGKTQIMMLLETEPDLGQSIDVFQKSTATHSEVKNQEKLFSSTSSLVPKMENIKRLMNCATSCSRGQLQKMLPNCQPIPPNIHIVPSTKYSYSKEINWMYNSGVGLVRRMIYTPSELFLSLRPS